MKNIVTEAGLIKHLRNSRVTKFIDLFVEDNRAFLITDYVEGIALNKIPKDKINDNLIVTTMKQMLEILDYIHSLSPPIIHRDFTLDNLIINSQNQITLIDFNVACHLESKYSNSVPGKIAFMAPEQFAGNPCPQSDIYSFGASLYALITGIEPEPLTQLKLESNSDISIKHKIYKEPILFTHQGLSGPASLKASLYFDEADIIKINWLPDFSLNDSFYDTNNLNIKLENFLNLHLPKRLTAALIDKHNFKNLKLNELKRKYFSDIINLLQNYEVKPVSTIGYQKAEVTKFGVDTDELYSNSMEVKSVKGLYFIGEVVDVTGDLGGYNFQWAWSSGYVAGLNV